MKEIKKSRLYDFHYFAFDFVRITAAPLGLLWFRTKFMFENESAKKKIKDGAVVISNHNGFYDPIHLMFAIWYRRHHFVCTEEIYRFPLTWFLCIPISRKNLSLNSFRDITNHLKNGDVVTMFPEGGVIADDSTVATFKSGMVMMAARSGCPIVPVYVLKRKSPFERLRVAVGSPVSVKERYGAMPTLTQINEITVELHDIEEKLKEICIKDKENKNV